MSWFIGLQKVLPQHAFSRLVGKLGASENEFIKSTFIHQFTNAYAVNLSEAERTRKSDYRSFNDFFTRSLAPGARPITADANALACPADGAISELGVIEKETLLQAKGHRYSLASLAGALGTGFNDGTFCTVYLAPKDYHRIHLPFDGTLTDTLAIPGALFSVNQTTAAGIEGLFCRNERLVCRFQTSFGPMLVILVGAMIVASIETVWEEAQSPYQSEQSRQHQLAFKKGDEIGRFLLGSTVICCFPPGQVALNPEWQAGSVVKMGQSMATLKSQD